MNIIKLLLLTTAYAEIKLIPLHPHPNTNTNQNRRDKESNEFTNSVVYNTIALLRNSGERGERLLTYYKQARFQQHEERRRGQQIQPFVRERNTMAVFPLFQGLGSHYCEAHVGTPPQVTTLLVDTGSEMTGFPCSDCVGCGEHTHPYFDPDKSSTFKEVSCDECEGYGAKCSAAQDKCLVGMSYLEGSGWKGYQSRDLFSLSMDENTSPKDLQVPFTFACETIETGLFESQLENGIMGLINANVTHLPNVLSQQNKIPNSFSLCMGSELTTSEDGVHSGIMTLGGYDDSHHTTPMVYVKNTGSFGYSAVIRKMYFQKNNGEIIPITADYQQVDDVLIDSGTTLTYLSHKLAGGFIQTWRNITGREYTNDKIEITQNEIANFPTIIMQLEGADDQKNNCNVVGLAGSLDQANCQDVLLKVPPSHYLFYYGGNTYSCEFHFEDMYGQGGIVGGNSMQGHDVFFDNEHNRIGFAESCCDYGDAIARDKP